MRLESTHKLMLTRRGVPLAFDVIDADDARPQPIIGRAVLVRWDTSRGIVWYTVKVQQGKRCLTGDLPIKHQYI